MTKSEKMTTTVTIRKSRWAAFFLTFLFGPLGLFYTTIAGGIVFTIIGAILIPITAGLAAIVYWPFCMILGVLTAGEKSFKVKLSQE